MLQGWICCTPAVSCQPQRFGSAERAGPAVGRIDCKNRRPLTGEPRKGHPIMRSLAQGHFKQVTQSSLELISFVWISFFRITLWVDGGRKQKERKVLLWRKNASGKKHIMRTAKTEVAETVATTATRIEPTVTLGNTPSHIM